MQITCSDCNHILNAGAPVCFCLHTIHININECWLSLEMNNFDSIKVSLYTRNIYCNVPHNLILNISDGIEIKPAQTIIENIQKFLLF